ncbi:MAG: phosphoribosyl-ATP diphosphatase [Clostridiales bacterium]|nr:phosphoribosyl-ATP diphosphatase [Clostridiales bacterium]
MSVLLDLEKVVLSRKDTKEEGSYTCYLFEKGIDKILKKVGEESSETIIAAKNRDKEELKGEVADLLYHLMVMCVEQDLAWSDVEAVLEERHNKTGNLKTFHKVDKNT